MSPFFLLCLTSILRNFEQADTKEGTDRQKELQKESYGVLQEEQCSKLYLRVMMATPSAHAAYTRDIPSI
jgi:hypothetical protein